jgi:hypothetical protein
MIDARVGRGFSPPYLVAAVVPTARRASLVKRGEGAAAPSNRLFGRFILSV